jgi:hypothetical protein
MKFLKEYFYCSPRLLAIEEIKEIETCINNVPGERHFQIEIGGRIIKHQTTYNKAFEIEFSKFSWEKQPLLYDNPRLIGDFRKNDVFVEIQFGNSATIYRDYYKFHYGLTHNLLSLAVLIVPTKPSNFFPTRVESVRNMAEFDLAYKYFKLLPIPVPILLIWLLPEN